MRLVAAALLLALSACGGTSHAGSASPTSVPLAQRVFVVRQITQNGTARELIGHPSIRFDATTFSADTGCNFIGGHYRVDGTRLVTSDMGGTTKACPGPRTRQEHDIAAVFASPAALRLSGNDLTIAHQGTVIVAESA